MVSYLFGGDTGETPESLKRKRDIAEAMIANRRTPQNVGEGLQAIGNAIMYRKMMSDIGAKEKSGLASADAAWSGLFGGGASTPGATGGSIPMPEAAGEVSATTPGATSVDLSGDKQTFIDSLLPAAMEESKRTGVDPRIIVAQAAQETGWGKSAPGNNFFGIKSHGQDGGNSMMTTEVIGGKPVRVRDSFCAYSSPADSVRGYGDFILQNPRYSDFRSAQGLDAQLSALQASGYATDPNYSRSVGAIARGIQLPQDVAAATPEAAFSAVMPEIGGGIPANADPILRRNMTVPSLSDEVAAFRGTPEHLQAYPGGYTQQDGQRQETPALPSEFAGSQQVKSAMDNRQGIVQALLGGSPASQEQIAQARNVGTQQQQTAQGPLGLDPRMLEALSNPFLSDGRKAVLKALIEQQMGQQQAEREMRLKQADPAYQVGLEKSRLELDQLRNPRTAEMQNLEYRAKQAGLEPGTKAYSDFMISGGKGDGVSVTVNNGEPGDGALRKKLDEKTGERWSTLQELGTTSAANAQDFQVLDELIKVAPQGPIQGRLAELFPGVSTAGAAFQSIVKRIAPTLRAPGSGATSDIEYDGMLKSLPALSNRPEANALINGIMKAKSAINVERSNVIDAYSRGEITAGQARTKIAEIDKKSIMTPEMKEMLDGLSGEGATKGGRSPASIDGYTIEQVD